MSEKFEWEPHTFLNDYGNVKTWSGRKTGTRIIVDEVAKVVIDRLEADLAQARDLLECLVDEIADAVRQTLGDSVDTTDRYLPLSVRYAAAEAAVRVVLDWRKQQTDPSVTPEQEEK